MIHKTKDQFGSYRWPNWGWPDIFLNAFWGFANQRISRSRSSALLGRTSLLPMLRSYYMFINDKIFYHTLKSLLSYMRIDDRNILAASKAFATEYFLSNCIYSSIWSNNLVFFLHFVYYNKSSVVVSKLCCCDINVFIKYSSFLIFANWKVNN